MLERYVQTFLELYSSKLKSVFVDGCLGRQVFE